MKLPILQNLRTDIVRPPAINACDGCTECCYAIGVEEVKKRYFQHCKHQKKSGCGIYENRPTSCRTYSCLYLTGYTGGGVENRPNNLGFVFQAYVLEDRCYVDVVETKDCSIREWQNMNLALNNILNIIDVYAVKLFLFDVEIGTEFHTEPVDMYMQGDHQNYAVMYPTGFPPLLIATKTRNSTTAMKIARLLSNGIHTLKTEGSTKETLEKQFKKHS